MAKLYCDCGNVLYDTNMGDTDGEERYCFSFDKLDKIAETEFNENKITELYKLTDFTFTVCSECKTLYLYTSDKKGFPNHMFEYRLEKEYDI